MEERKNIIENFTSYLLIYASSKLVTLFFCTAIKICRNGRVKTSFKDTHRPAVPWSQVLASKSTQWHKPVFTTQRLSNLEDSTRFDSRFHPCTVPATGFRANDRMVLGLPFTFPHVEPFRLRSSRMLSHKIDRSINQWALNQRENYLYKSNKPANLSQ